MSCSYVASTVCALARHVLRAVAHVGLQGACQGTGQSNEGPFWWPEARARRGRSTARATGIWATQTACRRLPRPPRPLFTTRRPSPPCSQSQQQPLETCTYRINLSVSRASAAGALVARP